MIKSGTIVIAISKTKGTLVRAISGVPEASGLPELLDTFSDQNEIEIFEQTLSAGKNPLEAVYRLRRQVEAEDEHFGNFIEEVLSEKGVSVMIQTHASQWFKSKLKIERFRKAEMEAREIIAEFAYQVFCENTALTDFMISGSTAQVQVRFRKIEVGVALLSVA